MLPHQPRQWASLSDLLHLPLHYGTIVCQSKQRHVQDLDMVSYDIEEMETDGRNAKVDLLSQNNPSLSQAQTVATKGDIFSLCRMMNA